MSKRKRRNPDQIIAVSREAEALWNDDRSVGGGDSVSWHQRGGVLSLAESAWGHKDVGGLANRKHPCVV